MEENPWYREKKKNRKEEKFVRESLSHFFFLICSLIVFSVSFRTGCVCVCVCVCVCFNLWDVWCCELSFFFLFCLLCWVQTQHTHTHTNLMHLNFGKVPHISSIAQKKIINKKKNWDGEDAIASQIALEKMQKRRGYFFVFFFTQNIFSAHI